MFLEDKDLVSIQEVRNLIRDAKKAQAELAKMSQEQIDTIVKVVAKACYDEREDGGSGNWLWPLGRQGVEKCSCFQRYS